MLNFLIAGTLQSTAPPLIHPPNLVQAIILGFVQGVTEFLPISSTAHLKVVPVVLGWGDPGVTFTAVVQLGSIAAVLWYFWSDLRQITQGSWRAISTQDWQAHDLRLAIGIGIGTLPIVIGGLLIKVFLPNYESSVLRSLLAIAITSIMMAILLGMAERWGRRQRDMLGVQRQDLIAMGFAQALALIPGVSRSGSTFTAGLFLGLDRPTTARLSFLLGIPSITLAGLAELISILGAHPSSGEFLPLIVGTLSSGVFSYLAIAWLLQFLQKRGFWIFVWYRIGFGFAILLALFFGQVESGLQSLGGLEVMIAAVT
ncbi:MAG: undecaprenyl-diphosphate phosphatase [Acaryochloridaceae cyanobacterium SU_2_1]|nr:undecaprenyl-diphosphate phosphatase [Acaryochloridaceae cyanobacterium SU_2_1]